MLAGRNWKIEIKKLITPKIDLFSLKYHTTHLGGKKGLQRWIRNITFKKFNTPERRCGNFDPSILLKTFFYLKTYRFAEIYNTGWLAYML